MKGFKGLIQLFVSVEDSGDRGDIDADSSEEFDSYMTDPSKEDEEVNNAGEANAGTGTSFAESNEEGDDFHDSGKERSKACERLKLCQCFVILDTGNIVESNFKQKNEDSENQGDYGQCEDIVIIAKIADSCVNLGGVKLSANNREEHKQ